MKSASLRLLLGTALLTLASCTNYYKPPSPDIASNAVISNTMSDGFYKYEHYWVQQVDGLPINYNWDAPGTAKIFLAPGKHRIVVQASQSGGFQSVPYRNEGELIVEASAGRYYKPKGYVQGRSFVIWIEEEGSGKNVTGKASIPLLPAMQGPPTLLLPPPVMLR